MDLAAQSSMSFPIPDSENPNWLPEILNTTQFICGSHQLQLFCNLISLNFPSYRDYDKGKPHRFLSQKSSGLENHWCPYNDDNLHWHLPTHSLISNHGQTISHVIVDLGKTVQFALSPFNAYVALYRSKGRDTICLLWDFEDNLFTRHPWEDPREEELNSLSSENAKRYYYNGKYCTCQRTGILTD